jgi:hypothetical protein
MKKITAAVLIFVGTSCAAMAQSVTVDVPEGYKVVVVATSVTVAGALSATVPQTVYVAPAPAAAPVYHPRVRHLAGVAEGMVIEHQHDDHN